MTGTDPPYRLEERASYDAWLEYHRATLLLKCEGLDAEQMARRSVPPSTLSLLGMVRHLASVEHRWFQGVLQGLDEPRLFKTGGPQPWYLAADPNLVDTVEFAHLEGQTEPFLDQRAGFEVDGVEIKIRHDFAAKALDFRGLFYNAGV